MPHFVLRVRYGRNDTGERRGKEQLFGERRKEAGERRSGGGVAAESVREWRVAGGERRKKTHAVAGWVVGRTRSVRRY
jgi:hypothetical protein